jgi:hypothetical protein
MTYPYPPPGPGEPVRPPEPVQPYQPPQLYQPDYSPYAPPYAYGPVQGQQPPAYPYDYGYGGYFGPPRSQQTDGFAIASLVVSCVSILGLCTWGIGSLLGVLGAIFGHVARRRIRTSGSGGSGVALAGIIVGWATAAIGLIFLAVLIVMIATTEDTTY